jgi:dTDP-glucose 4,6-dehydratase
LLQLMDKPESLLAYVKDRPGHDRRYALNWKKIERELGWKPAISLDEGLQRTIQWYQANTAWLGGVRGGEYRSYYEKYYKHRDSALGALTSSGPKPSS